MEPGLELTDRADAGWAFSMQLSTGIQVKQVNRTEDEEKVTHHQEAGVRFPDTFYTCSIRHI
jgi:hypothetical protein